ncbi:MAG: hypothetical protein WC753_04685 [Candidatus Gracilibacteria bacterium]
MNINTDIAQEVLRRLRDNHDASIGINWEVIRATCECVIYDCEN